MQDRKWNAKILKPESLTPLVQLLSYEVVEFSFTETHNDIEHKIRKKKKKKTLFFSSSSSTATKWRAEQICIFFQKETTKNRTGKRAIISAKQKIRNSRKHPVGS